MLIRSRRCSFIVFLLFSSTAWSAANGLGEWPVKNVSPGSKQVKTIFGAAPVGDFSNSPALVKARQEKERQSKLPKNQANIAQLNWRYTPEMLTPRFSGPLKSDEIPTVISLIPNANQIFQQALIPALKGKRYLINENEHLEARYQLANLARRVNKNILQAKQQSWNATKTDQLYRTLYDSLLGGQRGKVAHKIPLINDVICSQLIADMASYIYNPANMKFEQYADLMYQRNFCGSFPSRKMDGSLKVAYADPNLNLLLRSVKELQPAILMHASQKVITDITGISPKQAQQAMQKKKAQSEQLAKQEKSTAGPAGSLLLASQSVARKKGLNRELPKAPFQYTWYEINQVGYFIEAVAGDRKNNQVVLPPSIASTCGLFHPELRAMNEKSNARLLQNGPKGMIQYLMMCTPTLVLKDMRAFQQMQQFQQRYIQGARK